MCQIYPACNQLKGIIVDHSCGPCLEFMTFLSFRITLLTFLSLERHLFIDAAIEHVKLAADDIYKICFSLSNQIRFDISYKSSAGSSLHEKKTSFNY